MLKRIYKVLALLFVIASISLLTSCQEQQPVEITSGNQTLNKVSTFTIPAGASLNSAKLLVYSWDWSPAGDHVINIHNVTAPWVENSVTWSSFGAAYNPTAITSFVTNNLGWKEIDITSTVTEWLYCRTPNNGLLLKNKDLIVGWAQWLSKENEQDADKAPYLRIELSTGEIVELAVFADTYIRSDEPESNFGGSGRLYSGFLSDTWTVEKQTLIKFDIQCTPVVECETAYAFDGDDLSSTVGTCFIDLGFGNWGWSIKLPEPGSYTFPVYAAAGQCDISKGTYVGTVTANYAGGTVTFTYNFVPGFSTEETHFYAGKNPVPLDKKGKPTVAPGLYKVDTGLTGEIYIIAHAVVCGVYE